MTGDNNSPRLSGYERYIRTPEVLSLQLGREELIHDEEFGFHATHQAIEIELRICSHLLVVAHDSLTLGETGMAEYQVRRASEMVSVVTTMSEPLRHIAPSDFALIREKFGSASGAQSPGWRDVRRQATALERTFLERLGTMNVTLGDVYASPELEGLRGLAEALIDFDEQMSTWYSWHYALAERMLGVDGVGTGGMPIAELRERTRRRLFQKLLEARMALAPTE